MDIVNNPPQKKGAPNEVVHAQIEVLATNIEALNQKLMSISAPQINYPALNAKVNDIINKLSYLYVDLQKTTKNITADLSNFNVLIKQNQELKNILLQMVEMYKEEIGILKTNHLSLTENMQNLTSHVHTISGGVKQYKKEKGVLKDVIEETDEVIKQIGNFELDRENAKGKKRAHKKAKGKKKVVKKIA